jgi:N-acetylneuraminic acid mutarotase
LLRALCTHFQVYDITDNTWKSYDGLSEEQLRSDNAGFGDGSTMAYFVGGYNATYGFIGSVVAIDTVVTTESGILEVVDKNPLLLARGDLTAVTSADSSYAIVTGGFGVADGFCEPLVEVERYNFASGDWSLISDINSGRSDKALVEFQGHIFAMGGERQIIGICDVAEGNEPQVGEETIPVDDVEVYHPETDSWEVLVDDLPDHRFRFSAVGYDDIDSIYMFGGQYSYDETCQCFKTTDEIHVFSEKADTSPGPTSGAYSVIYGFGAGIVASSLTLFFV